MADEVRTTSEGSKTKVGYPADLASLRECLKEEKSVLKGIWEVHACSVTLWSRQKKIVETLEDRVHLLEQGQLEL